MLGIPAYLEVKQASQQKVRARLRTFTWVMLLGRTRCFLPTLGHSETSMAPLCITCGEEEIGRGTFSFHGLAVSRSNSPKPSGAGWNQGICLCSKNGVY